MHLIIEFILIMFCVLHVRSSVINRNVQPEELPIDVTVYETRMNVFVNQSIEQLYQRLHRMREDLENEISVRSWQILVLSVLLVTAVVVTLILNIMNCCLTDTVVKFNDKLKSIIAKKSMFVQLKRSNP